MVSPRLNAPDTSHQSKSEYIKEYTLSLYSIHFWGWNILFCALVLVNLAPLIIECTLSTISGEMPPDIYLSIITLCVIPLASIAIGRKNLKKPKILFSYFYGIEMPLMLLFWFRAIILKQPPLSASISLGCCLLAIIYIGYKLFYKVQNQSPKAWETLAQSIMLWIGLTAGILGWLFVISVLISFTRCVWDMTIWNIETDSFADLWSRINFFCLSAIFGIIFLFLISALLITPVVFCTITLKTWRKWLTQIPNRSLYTSGSLTFAILISLGLHLLSTHDTPPYNLKDLSKGGPIIASLSTSSDADLDKIRHTLTETYLHPYRYPFHHKCNPFNSDPESSKKPNDTLLGTIWTHSFSYLASPFIYRGGLEDVADAKQAYQNIFDTAIQKAEREKIKKAMEAYHERSETEAGLLDLEDKRVSVTEQALTIKDHDTWAEVELFETYRNNTFTPQELFYYFSLPKEATINGLYLGNTPNKTDAFKYRVSPRGAAQSVYKAQKVRRVDPALLEQVGPQQYRLRVFPIPSKQRDWGRTKVTSSPLYLWMDLQVLKDHNLIPLPTLLEKRNTEFAPDLPRTSTLETALWSPSNWLPPYAKGSHPTTTIESLSLEGKSLSKQPVTHPPSPKVCLIIDGSYSMRAHQATLADNLQELLTQNFGQLDLYLASPTQEALRSLDSASDATFLSRCELSHILNQYLSRDGREAYDHLILITDEGGYDISSDAKLTRPWGTTDGVLNILHLGGKLAPAYTDSVQDAISSSGGGIGLAPSELPLLADLAWDYSPNTQTSTKPPTDQPYSIAAKLLINKLSQSPNIPLDTLHTLAQTHHIVTPYSSMIVLVNQFQHRQLDEAEKKNDKFDRETDTGTEVIRADRSGNTSPMSTPEPSTSLFLAMTGLSGLWIRKRPSPSEKS